MRYIAKAHEEKISYIGITGVRMLRATTMQLLPGTGRWQPERLTEGSHIPVPAQTYKWAPSTTLRAVPLPVPGRNL